jgi:hypothetical protein
VWADYTRWSVFDKQCLMNREEPERECDFEGADEALDNPEAFGANGPNTIGVVQHLPRFWKDAGGVRVSGSYWFIPEVEGYIGAGYDSTAVPAETIDPALMDAHKMSISLGVRWQIIRQVALAFTVTELIFFRTSTKGKSALHRFESPTRQPSGNGVYKQFFQLFNIYVDVSFGYKDGKWKQRRDAKKRGQVPTSEQVPTTSEPAETAPSDATTEPTDTTTPSEPAPEPTPTEPPPEGEPAAPDGDTTPP